MLCHLCASGEDIPYTCHDERMAAAREVSFFIFFCSVNVSEKHLVSGDDLLVLALSLLLLSCFPFSSQWETQRAAANKREARAFEFPPHALHVLMETVSYGERTFAEHSLCVS